jgi:hypothetical protein
MGCFHRVTVVLIILCGSVAVTARAESLLAVSSRKIWDQAPHNAFTDLAHWNGQFVCAFREGRGHVSTDGKIRVLTSLDGDAWQPAALVALEGFDLRDAGLSIAPDGRLMLIGGASPRKEDNERAPTGAFVSFSSDAHHWSNPRIVSEPGRWLWRVSWHDGKSFGVAYAAPEGHPFTTLLISDNGLEFHELVPKWLGEGYPTEAVLRFADDQTAYCLQRRDGEPPHNSAYLGESKPPYTDWQWHDLKTYFGGPNFIRLPSGRWIAAGRQIDNGVATTVLAELDVNDKTLRPILTLASGGDTSYPGLVWHDGQLWVSYYSSHEGKANIYLANVKIE